MGYESASSRPPMRMQIPGFVIGLYFLSLQFVATINLSYLLLLAGFLLLLASQPIVHWRSVFSLPSLIAVSLFATTVLATWQGDAVAVNPAIAISHIPGLLIFLIAALFIRDEKQLSGIAWFFLVALLINSAHFFQTSYRQGFARDIRLIYFSAHPLYLAANDVLMSAVLLPLLIWFGRKHRVVGAVFIAAYVALLVSLSLLLLSRITLAVTAASLLLYFSTAGNWRLWRPALAAIVGAALMAYFYDAGFAAKLHSLDLTRLRVWIVAWQMFLDAPWFGHGPGSYSVLYKQYLQHSEMALQIGHEGRNMGWAHNLFFEAAAEKGLLGLAATIGYFIYLFAALRGQIRRAPSEILRALQLCALMLFIAACVELSLLRVWGIYIVYLLLGLVASFTAAAVPHGAEGKTNR